MKSWRKATKEDIGKGLDVRWLSDTGWKYPQGIQADNLLAFDTDRCEILEKDMEGVSGRQEVAHDEIAEYCRCCACGWAGPKERLASDYTHDAWSNTVCPACGAWDDFETLSAEQCRPGLCAPRGLVEVEVANLRAAVNGPMHQLKVSWLRNGPGGRTFPEEIISQGQHIMHPAALPAAIEARALKDGRLS